jgi:hypothetical protein
VPAGREGEEGPVRIHHFTGRQAPEHATLEEVLLPPEAG